MLLKMAVKIEIEFPLENDDECRSKAIEVVKQLKPEWLANGNNKLKFEFFTEGITNKMFCCWDENAGKKDGLIFRVYGRQTELIIDRNQELKNWSLLERNGCAAPVIGTFRNGLIVGYLHGKVLRKEDVRNPLIAREIARTMVRMHMIKWSTPETPQCCLFIKLNDFISNFPENLIDEEKNRLFKSNFPSAEKLRAEIKWIEEMTKLLESPLVFCHNDLYCSNILFDKDDNKVNFIDYEYAGYNYQAFDIANHFCEFTGLDDIDFNLYPDPSFQHSWLKTYLEFWNEANSLPAPTSYDIEKLYVQVNKFAAVCHLLVSVWAIIQSRHSTIDFNFLQYGLNRIQEYFKMKNKFSGLQLK